jgi:Ribbon-helix-helix protein, copG family
MPTVRLDIKTSSALCLDVMRTTLTLDDDVAAALERLRKSRDASLKDLVNEALRRGLIASCLATAFAQMHTGLFAI